METKPRPLDHVAPCAFDWSGEEGGGDILESDEEDEEPDNDRDWDPLCCSSEISAKNTIRQAAG